MNETPKKKMTSIRVLRRLLPALGLFLLCIIVSVTVPYAFNHPDISQDYM